MESNIKVSLAVASVLCCFPRFDKHSAAEQLFKAGLWRLSTSAAVSFSPEIVSLSGLIRVRAESEKTQTCWVQNPGRVVHFRALCNKRVKHCCQFA